MQNPDSTALSRRKGYGFITPLAALAMSPDSISTSKEDDIFVHMDEIKTKVSGWKCLYTGEYVEYTPSKDSEGRARATEVTGLNFGALLVDFGIIEYKTYYRKQFKTDTLKRPYSGAMDGPQPTTLGMAVDHGRRKRRRRGKRGGRKSRHARESSGTHVESILTRQPEESADHDADS